MDGDALLDTNVVIGYLKGIDPGQDIALMNTTAYLPSIVVGELCYGAYKSTRAEENLKVIESLVEMFTVLPVDTFTARAYGRLKRALQRQGKPIPENDLWIAALALQYDLTLLTFDKHFQLIPDLRIAHPLSDE